MNAPVIPGGVGNGCAAGFGESGMLYISLLRARSPLPDGRASSIPNDRMEAPIDSTRTKPSSVVRTL